MKFRAAVPEATTRRANARSRRLPILLFAGLLVPAAAWSQFAQYTAPGQLVESREQQKELLERAMKQARWKLGRFLLDPAIGLRDVAYVDNAQGTVAGRARADVTAALGAGLRLYRPLARELVFAAYALPQYVWWRELAARRRVNGRYGVGLFGNLGRTGLELSAQRTEAATFFSREFEVPVNTRLDRGAARLEVELGAGIALFAGGELARTRYRDEVAPALAELDLLDRDETLLRVGARFHLGGGLAVGVGAERSTVTFEATERDRSNRGTAPLLEVDLRGTRLRFAAHVAWRDLAAAAGSSFVAYRAPTGDARLEVRLGGRLRPELFGRRGLVYSIDRRWSYFEDAGWGGGLRASLGPVASLRVFGERGSNDFTAFGGGRDRRDRYRALGGELRVGLRRLTLLLGATRTHYTSNLRSFDRDITVIRSGLVFGAGGESPWG